MWIPSSNTTEAIARMKIPKKIEVNFPKNIEIRKARKEIIEKIVTISHGTVIFSVKKPESDFFFLSLLSIKS